jgi:hydroxyacylglutathione hydrolase
MQPHITHADVSFNEQTQREFSVIDLVFRVFIGHSPGGVCYYSEKHQLLFSGDILFQGSVGRTDLPLCDHADMQRSLARVMTLPNDVTVLPGHMRLTSIGEERDSNPFLQNLPDL